MIKHKTICIKSDLPNVLPIKINCGIDTDNKGVILYDIFASPDFQEIRDKFQEYRIFDYNSKRQTYQEITFNDEGYPQWDAISDEEIKNIFQ